MTIRMSVLLAVGLLAAAPARAQIDDSRRLLLELGYEDGLGNPGPSAPYAFLYLNRPRVAGPGSALRIAVAPVYADAELGLPGVLGADTDLGLGLSGGGFAFGQAQVDRGDEKRGEAFLGHGGGPSISLYPRIAKLGPVPVSGVFRAAMSYTDYQRTSRTDADFQLPPDQWAVTARAGIRAGGVEPGLDKGRAAEASAWLEKRVRDKPAAFGYEDDRTVARSVNLFWSRLHVSLPGPLETRVSGGLNAGAGGHVGRLSAYRLGGMGTQTAEFPLVIPGYFSQEISAVRFFHGWAQTAFPWRGSKRLFVVLSIAAAGVKPAPGTDPGSAQHVGYSAGLSHSPKKGGLHGQILYGYSPTALRGGRRGAHAFALTAEIDFLAPAETAPGPIQTRQQGLRWLFGPGR